MPQGRPRVQRVTVQCLACDRTKQIRQSEYDKSQSKRFFCTAACMARHGAKPRTGIYVQCEQCGVDIWQQPSERRRCCSTKCLAESQMRRIDRTCETCQQTFTVRASHLTYSTGRFCSKLCEGEGRIARPAGFTHNGRTAKLDQFGYVFVYEPEHPNANPRNGWIAQHRLVASQMLGRSLTPDDEVHHINRDKADNRPENLAVLDGVTHSQISNRDRMNDRELLDRYIARFGHIDGAD